MLMVHLDHLVWTVYERLGYSPVRPLRLDMMVPAIIGYPLTLRRSPAAIEPCAVLVHDGDRRQIVSNDCGPSRAADMTFAAARVLAGWLLLIERVPATLRDVYEFAAALLLPAPAIRYQCGVLRRGAARLARDFGVPLAIAKLRIRRALGLLGAR